MIKTEYRSSNDNELSNRFGRIKINNYHFYISRQKYINEYGQNFEICAILELNINSLNYNGSNFNKIRIDFVSKGSIKTKFSISNDTLNIEMNENDLIIWQTALREATKFIDFEIWEDDYFSIYLYSGSA